MNKYKSIVVVCLTIIVALIGIYSYQVSDYRKIHNASEDPVVSASIGRNFSNLGSVLNNSNKDKIVSSSLYPTYSNVKSMIESADMVVVGKVIEVNPPEKININIGDNRDTEPVTQIYTVSEIVVEEVKKGDVKAGDIIRIKQLGGETEDAVQTTEDAVNYLAVDDEGLFFLESYPFEIPCDTLNPIQGHILFKEGKIIKSKHNKLFSEGMTQVDALSLINKNKM